MKHLTLAAFAGAVACCAVTVSSQAAPLSGVANLAATSQTSSLCRSRAVRLRLPLLQAPVLAWLPSSLVVINSGRRFMSAASS